ncbi:MAG: hypothetical protein U0Q22_16785 [Acidimicrobiales bacterium]
MAFDTEVLIPALRAHLFEWLPRQRWFDAIDREVEDVTVIRTEAVRRDWPLVMWVPLEVMIDGAPVICQTVLAFAAEVPDEVPDRAIVGEVPTGGEAVMVYDALASPVTAAAFVAHVSGGLTSSSPDRVVDTPWITTVELPQQREVTLYRRVQAGAHPDVELTSLIAEAGHSIVRPPAAVWRKNHYDLATLRRNVRRGTDGAELARASVSELLRRRCQPRENPLDMMASLVDLGRAVSEMHTDLADRLGVSDGTGDALSRNLAARLPRQLDDAAADRVAAAYRRLSHADDLGAFIRIHGNLELRSVERTRNGWLMTRFGCNPDSSLVFEQVPLSPLCDIASLLHGFGVTAASALADVIAERSADAIATQGSDEPDFYEQEHRRELAVLAEAWEERSVDALIAGYTSNDAVHRLLPVERISRDALLALFELELSVRDAVRELSRDPELLRIPVEDVEDLATGDVRTRW